VRGLRRQPHRDGREAYIDGDGATGVPADTITLGAQDSSSIAAGPAQRRSATIGIAGLSVSVGAAVAFNEVNNDVAAYILDADNGVTSTTGNIDISANTLGKHLFNLNVAGLALRLPSWTTRRRPM
jgi:hypothetical protein